MTPEEFTQKMIQWRKTRLALDAIEAELTPYVEFQGKTIEIHGVARGKFRSATTRLDYDRAVNEALQRNDKPFIGELHACIDGYTKEVIDCRAVCKEMGLEPPVKSVGKDSVTFELIEPETVTRPDMRADPGAFTIEELEAAGFDVTPDDIPF